MEKSRICLMAIALILLPGICFAQSGASVEKDLQVAEAKLACCFKTASEFFVQMGRKNVAVAIPESQTALEKYRDAEMASETKDVHFDEGREARQYHASILLHLTRQRIDSLQRFFEYKLCNPSEVRVRNASGVDFKGVEVDGKSYGNVGRGETTDYQLWELAYRYSSVTVTADAKPLDIRPLDYVGETPLGEGKFTYVLTIKNGRLDIQALKDKP